MKVLDILEIFDYTTRFCFTIFDNTYFTNSVDKYFDKVLVINSDDYSKYISDYILNGIVKNIFVGRDIVYLYVYVDDINLI